MLQRWGTLIFQTTSKSFVLAVMVLQHIMGMKWGHAWKQMIQGLAHSRNLQGFCFYPHLRTFLLGAYSLTLLFILVTRFQKSIWLEYPLVSVMWDSIIHQLSKCSLSSFYRQLLYWVLEHTGEWNWCSYGTFLSGRVDHFPNSIVIQLVIKLHLGWLRRLSKYTVRTVLHNFHVC